MDAVRNFTKRYERAREKNTHIKNYFRKKSTLSKVSISSKISKVIEFIEKKGSMDNTLPKGTSELTASIQFIINGLMFLQA